MKYAVSGRTGTHLVKHAHANASDLTYVHWITLQSV
jgi:hypothetical protein